MDRYISLRPTDQTGLPPEVLPNILVGPNFLPASERNFRIFGIEKLSTLSFLPNLNVKWPICDKLLLSGIPYLFGQVNCIFITKKSANSQRISKRDVCDNHVIPVKLAGELSQPLDPPSMGCDASISLPSVLKQ